ncbi:GNAT family N-acetyltransferase [Virgibacillus doumboii]|uniref:GNAT family N-acetyltransferase n=1 Tax=Virgibacillus doumboii TaxID=2697503 RepID=UPI0013DF93E7|nr:GNAT family protein [Virgibacillus doumboii]
MLIREIKIEDAGNLIDLIKEVEAESNFMLMEADERKTTPEQQRKHIEHIEQQNNSTIFAAEDEEKLVGYLIVMGGGVKRTKHSANLVAGILKDYRGQGIGSALFQKLDDWAKNNNISRLGLTTVTQNEAGLALYKKNGFEIEGTKRNSLIVDGKSYDEYYMSKLL